MKKTEFNIPNNDIEKSVFNHDHAMPSVVPEAEVSKMHVRMRIQ